MLVDEVKALTAEECSALLAPQVKYTAEQHELAKLRCVVDRLFDTVYDLYYYGLLTEQWDRVELNRRIRQLAHSGDLDDDLVESLAAHFKIDFKAMAAEAEGGYHSGDCTATCCSCSRCAAEDFYKTNTAPLNKNIGSALWSRLTALTTKREQNESTATTI